MQQISYALLRSVVRARGPETRMSSHHGEATATKEVPDTVIDSRTGKCYVKGRFLGKVIVENTWHSL